MSRKRSHTKAFSMTDNLENGVYLLPGCYHNPQLECMMCEECSSDTETLIIEERQHLDGFPGDGLYIADACGNIFYNSDVGYVVYEEIVSCADARMESDDFSDLGSECEYKRTRSNTSSSEDVPSDSPTKELPGYIVEEPPDDEEDGKKQPK